MALSCSGILDLSLHCIMLGFLLLVGFHSCFSTWEVSAQGLQEEEYKEEKIVVMDHRLKIAHVMMLRQKNPAIFFRFCPLSETETIFMFVFLCYYVCMTTV